MSVVAFLLLTLAVVFLVVILVGLGDRIREIQAVVTCNQEDAAHLFSYLRGIDTAISVIDDRGGIHSEALRYIVGMLAAEVEDTVHVLYHPYLVELCFDDGVSAKKLIVVHAAIGDEDEIEILYDEDDTPGLCVTFDKYSLLHHPRRGYPEITIAIDDSIDPFRDRLLSDGWEITSPADDEESNDAVLPDHAESVCTGQ